jgi:hypothetical protein
MRTRKLFNNQTQPRLKAVPPPRVLELKEWPAIHHSSRRYEVCRLYDTSIDALPSLICEQWEQASNPEFNRLILQPIPSMQSLARRWADRFNRLGHSRNVLAYLTGPEIKETVVTLYRPVCTETDKAFLCFYYLHYRD